MLQVKEFSSARLPMKNSVVSFFLLGWNEKLALFVGISLTLEELCRNSNYFKVPSG